MYVPLAFSFYHMTIYSAVDIGIYSAGDNGHDIYSAGDNGHDIYSAGDKVT